MSNDIATQIRQSVAQIAQIQLRLQYQDMAYRGMPLPTFADVEFRCHSQNGEDGILLYIFSLIGTTNRKAVEICSGDGIECNAANLIINHGWQGLLFDGSEEHIERGRSFYAQTPTTWLSPPTLVRAWITADNVGELVTRHGFGGPMDLLSIDMDGNDYWIVKALVGVQPNVVVVEFSALCGPERAVSMAYNPDYRLDLTKQPYRCGASINAFNELLKVRGYRLVGIQSLVHPWGRP